ncbi:two-component sensor histidine kinase [Bacillus luteolus]|uniref:histidine kinase n=1 Tax=Litchfieldia luteola TaxID=682179 RepID=A0ABR9QKA9_9BACI|nr:ATP-binding protein [Cytobacillus luteolus]MBE4908943.1 two-component sensor histidine kinase [Cytobacillus luteolus]MBP1941802.1 two-component system sporulation sensor kinase B [Cytobacillus luteolus]
MLSIIKPLIVNITIIFSLTFNANLFFPFNNKTPITYKQQLIYGLISAFAGILCMFYPIESLGDTNFDFRMIPIMISTLYGGYLSGFVCLVLVVIVRSVIGGDYALIGIIVSVLPFIVAILLRGFYHKSIKKMAASAVVVAIYCLFYVIILYYKVDFLNVSFYLAYFTAFLATYFALIYIIEKLIIANQQFKETVYLDKLSMISQMAASIAHEIRNPITTVRGFIQFLHKDTNDEKLKQFAPLILEELDRTNKIITNYLKLTKPSETDFSKVEIDTVIKDSIELLRPLGMYDNVTILYQGSGNHYVYADEHHLKQALLNVIKNGIEAIEHGGYVKVTKRPGDDKNTVAIEIEDNGKGMNQTQLETIGLPYFTTKSKGTGLGSMITNRLIRDMNGKVEYESKLNKGTKVLIILPTIEMK